MKFLISTLLLLCISNYTLAQELENSTLWKIEGNGLKQPSYLFGTIHLTCDDALEADVLKALDQTEQLVLEIDMDAPDMQRKLMSGMSMKNGLKLKDLVSSQDFIAIDSLFIKNLGMSVKFLEHIKPFFLSASFYPSILECTPKSLEQALINVAKEQNEEIKGLETIEDQLQVFEDIPYKDQVADLVKSAKDNLAYDKAMFIKMINLYKAKNITAMLDMLNDKNYTSVAAHQDKLLVNRNIKWIPKIKSYTKEKATFFGVGAGHLAGQNGVINLLRKEGFKVTAVKS